MHGEKTTKSLIRSRVFVRMIFMNNPIYTHTCIYIYIHLYFSLIFFHPRPVVPGAAVFGHSAAPAADIPRPVAGSAAPPGPPPAVPPPGAPSDCAAPAGSGAPPRGASPGHGARRPVGSQAQRNVLC